MVRFIGCLLALVFAESSAARAEDGQIDFLREVRPILSRNCFACHGPDDNAREGDLRLDRSNAAYDSGAIVPGDPEASTLIARITSDDNDERMPPPDSRKVLTEAEIRILRDWIAFGGQYEEHWSFRPVSKTELPAVSDPEWPRISLDAFILANLDRHGLRPMPEADRTTLIRRVTLDLTGLPPSVAEVDAFLADLAGDAYDRLVERLLKSPDYGEHMARYWLDAARYADTFGLHEDDYQSVWPYRDWVIRAFNRNMPFDQFTLEQLAGDLLPEPTTDQLVATGFNRCHVSTNEGGVIDEEFLVRYAVDRTATTATVWMGLTAGCATCHDHKFDPLNMKEFYSLMAFFNNVDEKGRNGGHPIEPSLRLWTSEQRQRATQLEAVIAREKAAADSEQRFSFTDFSWSCGTLVTGKSATGSELTLQSDGSLLVSGPNPNQDTYTVVFETDTKEIAAIRLETLSHRSLPENGPGRAVNGNFVLSEVEVSVSPAEASGVAVSLELHDAASDFSQAEFSVVSAINGKTDDSLGWAIYSPSGLWNVNRTAAFEAVSPIDQAGRKRVTVKLHQQFGKQHNLGCFRLSIGERIDKGRSPAERHSDHPERQFTRSSKEEVPRLEKELKELTELVPVTMIMRERADPRPNHLLIRGQYDQKGEPVTKAVPAFLPALPETSATSRVTFANWLCSSDHPLTSRVIVNRLWQQCFGVGIVATADDFGSQGSPPSHPELLDYLAWNFMNNGWDVKEFMRMLVTSSTYRQSSRLIPESEQNDPLNRLLSRGPRFRLSGEAIRDSALAVSGLLVRDLYGPPVKPYQPPGLWKAVAHHASKTAVYKPDSGENLYRRSIYTFWKRGAPPPTMQIFDAPNRDACVMYRERTNTPLQALLTMNDVQFVEAARYLAAQILDCDGSDRDRIEHLFRSAVLRRPTEQEFGTLSRSLAEYRHFYQKQRPLADELLRVGEIKTDTRVGSVEHASWTMLCNQVLNLDEFVTKE